MVLTLSTASIVLAYQESPLLAEKVKAGKLPSVEKRLPDEPLVITPYDKIGKYGGIIRQTHMGPADSTGYWRIMHEPFVYYDEMYKKIYPNVATKYEILDNGKTIRWHIRKGLKWSDGVPFTTDDVLFWWEDVMLNKQLFPAVESRYVAEGQPMKVVKIDDFTVDFCFTTTYAGLVNEIAAGQETFLPKHYLKQFHPKYTKADELEKKIKEAGFKYWYELFATKCGLEDHFVAPGQPVLHAWVMNAGFDAQLMVCERNPYYFKVDPEGNQLPYIDAMHRLLVTDVEVIVMKLISGEIDFQTRSLWSLYDKLPLFYANVDAGNYNIIRSVGGNPGRIVMFANQTYDGDQYLSKLLKNKDFRKALSLGVNRHEINQIVFLGLANEVQGHSVPDSDAYIESVDKAYTEYDVKTANKMLDSIGLNKKDADGFRLRPDGKRLTLIIDVSTHQSDLLKGAELVAEHWKALGINAQVNAMDRSLFNNRRDSNACQMTVYSFTDSLIFLLDNKHSVNTFWAPLWYQWLVSNGAQGKEPPADVKRIWSIYQDESSKTSDPVKRLALTQEILTIWGDNFWSIGAGGVPFNLAFAKKNLVNIPPKVAHGSPGNPGIWRLFHFSWDK